jgi:hypothetical protein
VGEVHLSDFSDLSKVSDLLKEVAHSRLELPRLTEATPDGSIEH